ncbi:MAG: hypothetical protein HIU57_08895 [Acidobacteria bacterium]|nr:hypothetical protein [Acidobacteriota bacterium]
MSSGAVECFGLGNLGQLGYFYGNLYPTPSDAGNINNASTVSAGGNSTCALLSTGHVDCWGYNMYGQLGNGGVGGQYSTSPVSVTGISTATDVSQGQFSTCSVLSGGTIDCWGQNASGDLGDGNTAMSSVPVPVSSITNATSVSMGTNFACATLTTGHVDCWGDNSTGELGDGGAESSSDVPVNVSSITNAVEVSAGDKGACALLSTGSIDCWGDNSTGELGNASTSQSDIPVAVSSITNATAVSVGMEFACAVLSTGSVKCWGTNASGELGNASTSPSDIPVTVSSLSNAVSVSSGATSSCATLVSSAVWCWGSDNFDQLGYVAGSPNYSAVPVQIAGLDAVTVPGVLTAYDAALAAVVQSDHTIASWATYQGVVSANQVSTSDLQYVIDAATSAILAAQAADLVPVANLTAYTAALAAVVQSDYTTTSWAAYQTAITGYLGLTNQSLQSIVNAATTTILAAQAADLVVATANLGAYNAALAAVVQSNYTTISWAAYQTAIAGYLGLTNQSLQSIVNTATAAITTAQGSLVGVTRGGNPAPLTGPTNVPPPSGLSASDYGTPNSGTASSTAVTTVTQSSGGASETVTVPAGALPAGTTISVYPITDTSTLTADVPAGESYVHSFAVSWETPSNTSPTSSTPLTITITDASIKAGDTIYELISTGLVVVGTATVDGSVTLTFSNDPVFLVTHTAPVAQSALSVTTLLGRVGTALSLVTRGGSGSGVVSYTVTNGTATGCGISGGSLTVVSAGTCFVTATKAADANHLAASSSVTTVTFTAKVVSVSPHAIHVHGYAQVGRTVALSISGTGFYGRPKVTSNEVGTRVVLSHGTDKLLTVRVTVRARSRTGWHTFTIRLANGKSCRVNYKVVSVSPHAIHVHGYAQVGRTVALSISGTGFYGRPKVTSNEVGTRVVLSHGTDKLLTVRVTVRARSRTGWHTFTIRLANGKSCRVNYLVK